MVPFAAFCRGGFSGLTFCVHVELAVSSCEWVFPEKEREMKLFSRSRRPWHRLSASATIIYSTGFERPSSAPPAARP